MFPKPLKIIRCEMSVSVFGHIPMLSCTHCALEWWHIDGQTGREKSRSWIFSSLPLSGGVFIFGDAAVQDATYLKEP
jgi:hypothetical protein